MSINGYENPSMATTARLVWSEFMASRFQPQRGQLAELDSELELLHEFSALVKAQRNSVLKSHKLPSEILGHVFSFLKDTWPPMNMQTASGSGSDRREGASAVRYDLGWIKISHVCSLWRAVALSIPLLWCTVDCANVAPRMRKAILKRSSNQPLDLKLDYGKWSGNMTDVEWTRLWLKKSTCRRIRSLHMINNLGDFYHLDRILRQFHALPELTELSIDLRSPLLEIEIEAPPTFYRRFSDASTQLKRVTLRDCLPPLSSPVFSHTLTHLVFELSSDYHQWAPRINDMLDMLSTLRALEELHLANIPSSPLLQDDTHSQSQQSGSLCTLPACFRELVYVFDIKGMDGSTSATHFLSRLRLPRRATILIKMLISRRSRNDSICARLVEAASQAVNMQQYHWTLATNRDQSILIRLHEPFLCWAVDPTHVANDRTPRDARFSIKIVQLKKLGGERLKALDVLPLANLICLELSSWTVSFCFPSSGAQSTALFTSRAIRHIAIRVPLRTSFFTALSQTREDGSQDTMVLVPCLETLTLRWDKALPTDSASGQTELRTLFSGVREAATVRCQHAISLHEIHVDRRYDALFNWESIKTTSVSFFEGP